MSNSAVLRGYLDLLGVGERAERPSRADVRELRRRNGRLERRLRELERRNRQLSQALEASEARRRAEPRPRATELEGLQRMSGALAHVFNNLMTGIGCSADLARTALPEESEGHEHLDTIDQAWKRGSEVCRRLLTASGEAPFSAAELDLNEVVRQLEPVVATSVGKRARVRTRLEAERVPLMGDATLLRQLILELTANAAEAIGDRPGRISISTGRRQRSPEPRRTGAWVRRTPEPWVVLEVSDDGRGIEPEQVARIFDPFFSTKFLGRGLGLTAAYSIVEKHGGTLRVRSQPGRGSTFQVLLPALHASS